jgi:hypothetical protein
MACFLSVRCVGARAPLGEVYEAAGRLLTLPAAALREVRTPA